MANDFLGTTRVIGNWKPRKKLDRGSIVTGLNQKLKNLGYSHFGESISPRRMTVRMPNYEFKDGSSLPFHQDRNGHDYYMILWSNINPTEVRLKDGTMLPVKDGDIVLLQNAVDQHRTPPIVDEYNSAGRWFVRISDISPEISLD